MASACRCACADGAARAACLGAGYHWDHESCSCLCHPADRMPSCPSGYFFDPSPPPLGACRCVPLVDGERAATDAQIAAVVIASFICLFACSGYQVYRYRGALAEATRRRRHTAAAAGGHSVTELRALFRQTSRNVVTTAAAPAIGARYAPILRSPPPSHPSSRITASEKKKKMTKTDKKAKMLEG